VSEAIVQGNKELHAGAAGAAVDFVLLLQSDESSPAAAAGRLPDLPANARYVWHRNSCYDWGSFGWLVREATE
jgi:hypothetical protein